MIPQLNSLLNAPLLFWGTIILITIFAIRNPNKFKMANRKFRRSLRKARRKARMSARRGKRASKETASTFGTFLNFIAAIFEFMVSIAPIILLILASIVIFTFVTQIITGTYSTLAGLFASALSFASLKKFGQVEFPGGTDSGSGSSGSGDSTSGSNNTSSGSGGLDPSDETPTSSGRRPFFQQGIFGWIGSQVDKHKQWRRSQRSGDQEANSLLDQIRDTIFGERDTTAPSVDEGEDREIT